MHRILIVAPTRSASTYFFNHLRDSFFHQDFDNINPQLAGEWGQKDSWIMKSHEPLMLFAQIDSVVRTTSLRNPVDNISSIVNKHSFGFGKNTIAGRPDMVEDHISRIVDDKSNWLAENIYQESMMWEGYAYYANNNIDKIYPFTFEQVTTDIINVIQNLHDATAEIDPNRGPVRVRSKEDIKNMDAMLNNLIMNDISQSVGATNLLPVEKSESYYEIRDAVLKSHNINRLNDLYEDTKQKIYDRQKSFNFKLESN